MKIILDGARIHSKETLYDAFIHALCLPSDYEQNLDALADCLTDPGPEIEIVIRNPMMLKNSLHGYYDRLLFMLTDTMSITMRLKVTFEV